MAPTQVKRAASIGGLTQHWWHTHLVSCLFQIVHLEPRYSMFDVIVDASKPPRAAYEIKQALQRLRAQQQPSVALDEHMMAQVQAASRIVCPFCANQLSGMCVLCAHWSPSPSLCSSTVFAACRFFEVRLRLCVQP